jgi:hypothetical protein
VVFPLPDWGASESDKVLEVVWGGSPRLRSAPAYVNSVGVLLGQLLERGGLAMDRFLSRRVYFAFVLTSLLVSAATPLSGQNFLPNGAAVGGTVDRFFYEGESITALTFRFSGLRSRHVGSEIGVSMFPDGFRVGALLLAPDAGPAFNLSVPGATILMKAGLSSLLGLGGGFSLIPGYHLGGGMIVRIGDRAGLRIDAVRHTYLIDSASESLWSLGLGFTGLAGKAAP